MKEVERQNNSKGHNRQRAMIFTKIHLIYISTIHSDPILGRKLQRESQRLIDFLHKAVNKRLSHLSMLVVH